MNNAVHRPLGGMNFAFEPKLTKLFSFVMLWQFFSKPMIFTAKFRDFLAPDGCKNHPPNYSNCPMISLILSSFCLSICSVLASAKRRRYGSVFDGRMLNHQSANSTR